MAAAASVERVVEVEPGSGDLVIGRRRGHEIELPFSVVSEQHARLSRTGQGWTISDLSSANGTYVNGRRLTPFVAQALSAGDVLGLASIEMVFEGEERPSQAGAGEAAPESTATLARRLVNDLFGARRPGEVARLLVLGGPAGGRELRLELAGRPYRVGRVAGCNLVVPDDDMSREHAELERRWDGVFVRDLHSKNGVLVMGERVSGERRLADGDVLQLGQTTLRLDDPEDRYLRQMEEGEAGPVPAGTQGDRADEAALSDTHTSSEAIAGRAGATGLAASRGPVGRGQGPARRGPLALVVIAVLVLAGAIGLALSFLLQN